MMTWQGEESIIGGFQSNQSYLSPSAICAAGLLAIDRLIDRPQKKILDSLSLYLGVVES